MGDVLGMDVRCGHELVDTRGPSEVTSIWGCAPGARVVAFIGKTQYNLMCLGTAHLPVAVTGVAVCFWVSGNLNYGRSTFRVRLGKFRSASM